MRQGEVGDSMFVVVKGAARLVRRQDPLDPSSPEVQLPGELGQADYFGERALAMHEPRTATVLASGSLRVARLSRDAVERLLGSLQELLRTEAAKREAAWHELQRAEEVHELTLGHLRTIGVASALAAGTISLVAVRAAGLDAADGAAACAAEGRRRFCLLHQSKRGLEAARLVRYATQELNVLRRWGAAVGAGRRSGAARGVAGGGAAQAAEDLLGR